MLLLPFLLFLLFSSHQVLAAVVEIPARSRVIEDEYLFQSILSWLDGQLDLRTVSRPFKRVYDASRYLRLDPSFWPMLEAKPDVSKSIFSPPQNFLQIIAAKIHSAFPNVVLSRHNLDFLVSEYLPTLSAPENDVLYFNTFKLLKLAFVHQPEINLASIFDLKRLARVIASRPFSVAECTLLFINENASVDGIICPSSGRNVLQEAIFRSNLALAEWLLNTFSHFQIVSHLDLNRRSALHYACAQGNLELVKKIFERYPRAATLNDDKLQNPLDKAVRFNHLSIVKFLRSKQSPINGAASRENAAFTAIKNHALEPLSVILRDAAFNFHQLNRERLSLWQAAVKYGNVSIVKMVFNSKHCCFSPEEWRAVVDWSRMNASSEIFEFIEDNFVDAFQERLNIRKAE